MAQAALPRWQQLALLEPAMQRWQGTFPEVRLFCLRSFHSEVLDVTLNFGRLKIHQTRRRGPARCQAPGAAFPECFSVGVRRASARRQRPSAAPSCAWAGRAGRRVAMESDDTGNRLRFQLELEFVQCLANPNYLNFLAQRGYFKDKAFVNYLKYLLYWKEPEYAKYLKYPQCLHMLELLQYEHFRKELVNAQCAKFIDEQQILHWQHYSRKRMRLQQALAEQQQQNNTSVK
ncbi:mediator of RNA polymerase II transcription subunit 31 [Falco peregrinus]|uniref:mediator of RNA polymerase II transcription subunit 31 n=1 Tax=Falco peregrinus TaxID=8954 RepID=UPI0024799D53|nr:mediator of RNA polymerase II transcription subunit 31 [Falco peregrinus]